MWQLVSEGNLHHETHRKCFHKLLNDSLKLVSLYHHDMVVNILGIEAIRRYFQKSMGKYLWNKSNGMS